MASYHQPPIGPEHFADILAQAQGMRGTESSIRNPGSEREEEITLVGHRTRAAGATAETMGAGSQAGSPPITSPPPEAHRVAERDPDYFLHETRILRSPAYRTERADLESEPAGSYFDHPAAEQLPLLTYEYDAQTTVITRIGELGTRDMLVMSVLSQAFYVAGCPGDNTLWGDPVTMGNIARLLGMHPEGATRLIRASVERLSTARVRFKIAQTDADASGGAVATRGEVTVGFLANFGWRERKQRGRTVDRDNFIQLDQAMADLIRAGQFTFLKAEVLRALRRQPLALKLYAWARTHRPDDRGRIFYGVGKLAQQLGCSDKNSTRRRRKVMEAAEAVCAAAPAEFPGFETREGRHDHVLVLRKRVRVPERIAS